MTKSCLLSGCHASGGTSPNLSAFATLDDMYKKPPGESNMLVTKMARAGGTHSGQADYTADQKAIIISWIDTNK